MSWHQAMCPIVLSLNLNLRAARCQMCQQKQQWWWQQQSQWHQIKVTFAVKQVHLKNKCATNWFRNTCGSRSMPWSRLSTKPVLLLSPPRATGAEVQWVGARFTEWSGRDEKPKTFDTFFLTVMRVCCHATRCKANIAIWSTSNHELSAESHLLSWHWCVLMGPASWCGAFGWNLRFLHCAVLTIDITMTSESPTNEPLPLDNCLSKILRTLFACLLPLLKSKSVKSMITSWNMVLRMPLRPMMVWCPIPMDCWRRFLFSTRGLWRLWKRRESKSSQKQEILARGELMTWMHAGEVAWLEHACMHAFSWFGFCFVEDVIFLVRWWMQFFSVCFILKLCLSGKEELELELQWATSCLREASDDGLKFKKVLKNSSVSDTLLL